MNHEEETLLTTTTTTTTLTILPCHLSLVHIPLDQISQFMYPILQTWWYRDLDTSTRDPFFALCRNQLELSLFASSRIIKQNFGTCSNSKGAEDGTEKDKVLISDHPWIALEICVAVNGIEKAGHRIHTLTSPLAALSISILFLSTFSSDFILVRAKDLSTVIKVLQQEGFTFNDDEEEDLGYYHGGAIDGGEDLEEELQKSFESIIIQGGGGGVGSTHRSNSLSSRSLSMSLHEQTTTTSSPSTSPQLSRQNSHSSKPSPATTRRNSSLNNNNKDDPSLPLRPPPPNLSKLPITNSVKHQNLINIGLSLDPIHLEISRKKLLQLFFYPQTLLLLLSTTSTSTQRNEKNIRDRNEQEVEEGIYCSIVETCDSISITSDLRILRKLFCDSSGIGGGGAGEEMVFVSGVGGLGGGEWEGEYESESDEEIESSSENGGGGREETDQVDQEEEEEGWENVRRGESNRRPESVTSDRSSVQGGGGGGGGGRTLLECLQLDLLSLGLDASGLAHHYAAVLIEGGVKNFMLQSSFGSANLLVSKKEAKKAKELLLLSQSLSN